MKRGKERRGVADGDEGEMGGYGTVGKGIRRLEGRGGDGIVGEERRWEERIRKRRGSRVG